MNETITIAESNRFQKSNRYWNELANVFNEIYTIKTIKKTKSMVYRTVWA